MKTAIFVAALMAAAPAFAQATPAPAPAAPAPAAPASDAKFNLDTPLQDIVADEKGKAVIEKHFPGMIALPE
ncbi:MAG: hypothetical protein ACT6QT_06695 [Sphingopyxis sp.]|jgi:hypothetical protein